MAAVLAIGGEAVLSHGSAAALWGLLQPSRVPVDVSVPTRAGRRRRKSIRIHRRTDLIPEHRTSRDGIPVTTPARRSTCASER
jgi:predicted transcriptional regulator of viral defense system